MFWVGFGVGVMVGCILGVFTVALCSAARDD